MENLTLSTFKEKVFNFDTNKDWKFLGDKPCIIDFYATYCGSCKIIVPILEDLSKEYEGKIDIYKVNIFEEEGLEKIFGIQSVPSVFFIPITGEPQVSLGAIGKEEFVQMINDVLLIPPIKIKKGHKSYIKPVHRDPIF